MHRSPRRLVRALFTLFALTAAPLIVIARADAAPGAQSKFVPLAPTRILDTRLGLGSAKAKVAANASIDVTVTGVGGVPASGVSAVALNVTAAGTIGPGFIQVFPTGQSQIGASSNLNVEFANQNIPNFVIVPVGNGGKVTIYTQGGADLIADVSGYFVASGATADGRYVALAPHRVLDTRADYPNGIIIDNPGDVADCDDFDTWDDANRFFWYFHGPWGDPAHLDSDNNLVPCETLPGAPANKQPVKPLDLFKLEAGEDIRFNPGVPGEATAVVLNITATNASAPGFVQVVPSDGPTPLGASSNLNLTEVGQTMANLVIVPLGDDGTVTIFSEAGTHVIADVAGYFTDASATSSTVGLFVPLGPERMLDTRSGFGAPKGIVGDNSSINFTVRGTHNVPSVGASAVFLNVTATETVRAGYVSVIPKGSGPALTSTLNVAHENQTIANAAISTLSSTDGALTFYTYSGTHLLADIAGYFTDAA